MLNSDGRQKEHKVVIRKPKYEYGHDLSREHTVSRGRRRCRRRQESGAAARFGAV